MFYNYLFYSRISLSREIIFKQGAVLKDFLKRTWIEVDSNALEENYKNIRNIVDKNSKIMCVVKADAYGHGAEFLSRLYQNLGADWLAVSNLEEAIQIRKSGIDLPILILGYTQPDMACKLSCYSLTQTVMSLSYAEKLSENALKFSVIVDVHIKIDTGMNRIGLNYQDMSKDRYAIYEIEKICRLKHICASGLYTHFSSSDNKQQKNDYTIWQFNNFQSAIENLKKLHIEFRLKHCSNSGAILNYPSMNMDLVRAGIILYGLLPSSKINARVKFYPAMQWKTIISQIKRIRPGSAISYGGTFCTKQKTIAAAVPVGYADGYPRALSRRAEMIVCGKRAPILGTICMDQLVLDITSISGANKNSIVTILGRDKTEEITVDELSLLSDRINYELICTIGKRVTRFFLKEGQIVEKLNYICPN